jgi:two-component system alkaline phosphatase synthesis response regulator PhoP
MNPKKILVVDDSRVILKALSMRLTKEGYTVFTAADGSEAVRLARKELPDLILLDISFPPDVAHGGGVAWDGFLIMAWLHRMDELKNVPIVIITGSEPEKYKARALAAGAVNFFHKPLENEELVNVVRQTLGDPAPAVSVPA